MLCMGKKQATSANHLVGTKNKKTFQALTGIYNFNESGEAYIVRLSSNVEKTARLSREGIVVCLCICHFMYCRERWVVGFERSPHEKKHSE